MGHGGGGLPRRFVPSGLRQVTDCAAEQWNQWNQFHTGNQWNQFHQAEEWNQFHQFHTGDDDDDNDFQARSQVYDGVHNDHVHNYDNDFQARSQVYDGKEPSSYKPVSTSMATTTTTSSSTPTTTTTTPSKSIVVVV